MSKQKYFFELNDDVGIDSKGNPEPAVVIGLSLAVPTMRDGKPVNGEHRIDVQPIDGTRVYVTDDALIADALRGLGSALHEIDEPSKTEVSKAAKTTEASREAAKNTDSDGEEK